MLACLGSVHSFVNPLVNARSGDSLVNGPRSMITSLRYAITRNYATLRVTLNEFSRDYA